jgi:hypothetical protein
LSVVDTIILEVVWCGLGSVGFVECALAVRAWLLGRPADPDQRVIVCEEEKRWMCVRHLQPGSVGRKAGMGEE